MENTSKSLLGRAQQGEEVAWRHMVDLYRPLIRAWLAQQAAPQQELDDLCQDILAILVKELNSFSHAGRLGSFRTWLRTITVNRARKFWRAGKCRPTAPGGPDLSQRVDQLEDDASPLVQTWNDEHDRHVLRQLFQLMESEFEPATLRTFRRLTFDGASAQQVAADEKVTVAAVYGAKLRVLQRLRQEAAGLLEC